jgi:hypothetical protein
MTELEPETLTETELTELFADTSEDAFDCLSARFAFIFQKHGAQELRECLFPNGVPENLRKRLLAEGLQPDYYREDLIDAADELTALGLNKPAAIALEISTLKQSRFDKPCPRWQSFGYWHESMRRQRKAWEAKRKTLTG